MKLRKLFKLENHPYISISSGRNRLYISFQDSYSSYSKWYKLIIEYDKDEKGFTLVEEK
jgi:hypothetical protein